MPQSENYPLPCFLFNDQITILFFSMSWTASVKIPLSLVEITSALVTF